MSWGLPLPLRFAEFSVWNNGFQEGNEVIDSGFFKVDFEAGQGIGMKAGDDHFPLAVDKNEVIARPVSGMVLDGVFPVEQLDCRGDGNTRRTRSDPDQAWVYRDHGEDGNEGEEGEAFEEYGSRLGQIQPVIDFATGFGEAVVVNCFLSDNGYPKKDRNG
jgi:hypothetical protein